MISYEHSLKIIEALVYKINQSENCTIASCLGRISASNIRANFDSPKTHKSAMDGILILEKDLNVCKTFTLKTELKPGQKKNIELSSKEAALIYTGASIPGKKKKIVVIKENCDFKNFNKVVVKDNLNPDNYIRKSGQDFKKGTLCLKRDAVINIRIIGLLKTLEKETLKVRRKPRVGVIVTGDEILTNKRLKNKEYIPSSNSEILSNFIKFFGADLEFLKIVKDSEKEISAVYNSSKNVDLLITTGGLSEGKYDLVKNTFSKLGLRLKFEKVAIRPGKPISFGLFNKNKYFLGLPGNPISCFVGCLFFLNLIVNKLQGSNKINFKESFAKSFLYIPKNNNLTKFLRINIFFKNKKMYFKLIPNQDSSMQLLLTESDGIIIRKPFAKSIRTGQNCKIILFKDFSNFVI